MSDLIAENLFNGPLAEEYEMLKKICPAAADMSRRVGEFVAACPPPSPREWLEVLEIGTGTGITTLHLLHGRPDLRITGVDNSETMLNQARRHLAAAVADQRVRLVENDALSHLERMASASVDIVASGYALHNFLDGYRRRVLEEIFRVLQPGGAFVNGDRYALDDPAEHLAGVQDEVRGYFRVFLGMDRPDLLEQWIVHLYSDESPHHLMRLGPALDTLGQIGFRPVTVHYRDGVNSLVSGVKPWP